MRYLLLLLSCLVFVDIASALNIDRLSPSSNYACVIGGARVQAGRLRGNKVTIVPFSTAKRGIEKERQTLRTRLSLVSEARRDLLKGQKSAIKKFGRLVRDILKESSAGYKTTKARLEALDRVRGELKLKISNKNVELSALNRCKKGGALQRAAEPRVLVGQLTPDAKGVRSTKIVAALVVTDGRGVNNTTYCVRGRTINPANGEAIPFAYMANFIANPCQYPACPLPRGQLGLIVTSLTANLSEAEVDQAVVNLQSFVSNYSAQAFTPTKKTPCKVK
jgi:hypothetical protein